MPRSQQINHARHRKCRFIWAHFPRDLGISLADCCCHIWSLFGQHAATPVRLLCQMSQAFPLHFTPFLSTTRIDLLTYGKIHKTRLGGEGASLVLDALEEGLGISPARTNFTGGGTCIHGHPGLYRSTPIFANTGYVHANTLRAAYPSGWQQTAALINHYPPVNPKGSETPVWGLGAVLQICRP